MNLTIFQRLFKSFKKKRSLLDDTLPKNNEGKFSSTPSNKSKEGSLLGDTLPKNNEGEFSSTPSNKSKKGYIPLFLFIGTLFFYILLYSKGGLIIEYHFQLDDISETSLKETSLSNSESEGLCNPSLRETEDNVSSDLAKDSKNRNNQSQSNEKVNRWIKRRTSFITKIPLKFLFLVFFIIRFTSNNKAKYTLKLF